MTIFDLPPIRKGIWRTKFKKEGREVITLLNAHERIQTELGAKAIAAHQLQQFNPKLEWDDVSVTLTDERSL